MLRGGFWGTIRPVESSGTRSGGCSFPRDRLKPRLSTPPNKVGASGEVWGRYGWRWAGALDPKLTHPMTEGVGVEVQDSRCALGSLDDSVGLLQNCADMSPLNLFQSGQRRMRPRPAGSGAGFLTTSLETDPGARSGPRRRVGPGDKITARSMTFCISRTFPGHA